MNEVAQASPAFQRAFVGMSYLIGRRGEALTAGLPSDASDAERLAKALSHPDRKERANTLGRELTRIADALAARAY